MVTPVCPDCREVAHHAQPIGVALCAAHAWAEWFVREVARGVWPGVQNLAENIVKELDREA